jgi:hypothetical protein
VLSCSRRRSDRKTFLQMPVGEPRVESVGQFSFVDQVTGHEPIGAAGQDARSSIAPGEGATVAVSASLMRAYASGSRESSSVSQPQRTSANANDRQLAVAFTSRPKIELPVAWARRQRRRGVSTQPEGRSALPSQGAWRRPPGPEPNRPQESLSG